MSDDRTERIIGAAVEVYRELGSGLLESVHEEALCHEFALRQLPETAVAQVLSHLKATGLRQALLINFGAYRLSDGIRRISL